MANSNSSFGVSNPVINQSPQLTVDFVLDHLRSKGAPDEVLVLLASARSFSLSPLGDVYIQDRTDKLYGSTPTVWIKFQEEITVWHNNPVWYFLHAEDEVKAGITTTKAFYNGFGWRIKTEDTNRLVD